MIDVDLFAGAGGAATGLASLGIDAVGFEWNLDAARTHHAAGYRTVVADLAAYPWTHVRGRVRLMHGSPPCQPFSAAGVGAGADDPRDGMPWMLRAVEEAYPVVVTIENVAGLTYETHAGYLGGMLRRLSGLGYDVDHRVLNAADYGVPQTRRRLIVVARRDGHRPVWPVPTHTEEEGLFTASWVTMAAALGWGMTERPFLTVAGANESGGFDPNGLGGSGARAVVRSERDAGRWLLNTGRDWKPGEDRSAAQTVDLDAPAPAVSTVPGQWQWRLRPGRHSTPDDLDGNRRTYDLEEPAPTVAFGNDTASWVYERPATTIAGDVRVSRPGRHDPDESGSQQRDAIRVPLADLATLQGFPPGYPFHGTRTSVARQIGNALPPALIAAVVGVNL